MSKQRHIFHRIRQITNAVKVISGYCASSVLHRNLRVGMPLSASVEPANYCNLKCPQCPTGMGLISKRASTLPLAKFKQAIDAFAPELIYLNLYFQGEPTLNKELSGMVRYATDNKIITSVSTNGHFLNPDVCRELKSAGLGKLIVSLDGADEESYNKYRRGGDFNKVIEGIKNAVQAGLKVELQCLLLSSTENQLQKMKELAKKLGVWKLTFKTAQFYKQDSLMPSDEKNSRYKKGTLTIKRELKNRCWRVMSGIVITTEGEVLPCCYDKEGAHSYGNLFKEGATKDALCEILHSQRASDFITSVFTGRKCNKICTNCTE